MDVQFIASIAVIAPDPSVSRRFYVDALGLPLMGSEDDYVHSEDIDGSKSFGVWPLTQAAQACFGTPDWPADRPVPQASIEFEVADADAVQVGADELKEKGFTLLHEAHTEPGDRQSLGFSQARVRSSASRTCPQCIRSKTEWPPDSPPISAPTTESALGEWWLVHSNRGTTDGRA